MSGIVGDTTWCASTDQSGCSMNTATAKTIRLSPSRPVTFSMIENPTRQTTIHTANAATGIHNFGPTSLASCNASAIPPISAVTVIRLMKNDAPRFAAAERGPSRSRMISKVARPLTAATRPAICAYRQIPSTPTGTTQASASPNLDPTTALVTRSPISRNPPMAVRMPRATAKIFFISGSPARVRRRHRAGADATRMGRVGRAAHARRHWRR